MRPLVLAAASILLLLFPRAAFACSCIGDVPLCQSFWQADAVFAGNVWAPPPAKRD